ncbi:AI-2E family transporter [Clostridium celatum]|nr:AI-2E family transporter [Clostridium celatum]MCE9653871.1 AI-2E family transporter [Clostridium celatum]MDU3722381.1 AI-2E family transporter [Clostridium celatum]MDU6297344.1 AI-2E family transporter [Clostridium celatum]MDY3362148.1 AI-2E family transporter [Clostridium celatum]
MRFYNSYKKNYQYEKLLSLVLLLGLFIILTYLIKNYFKPFLTIIILSMLCKPIDDALRRININEKISGALTILIINVMMFCFIFYFGNSIFNLIEKIYTNYLGEIRELIQNIKNTMGIDIEEILQNNKQVFTSNTFKNGLVVTGQGILSYIVANITVYFFIVDRKLFFRVLNRILPYNVIYTIRKKRDNLREVLKIEVILVFICMIITIIGFLILRIPNAIFLGVVCGILDILPYVGTIIVFIPIIIYNIIIKKYLLVIGLIALYLLLQIVREILELKYLSYKLDIHPLVVLLSMYIGAESFGIIGILVGPIYCLLAKDIIYEENI